MDDNVKIYKINDARAFILFMYEHCRDRIHTKVISEKEEKKFCKEFPRFLGIFENFRKQDRDEGCEVWHCERLDSGRGSTVTSVFDYETKCLVDLFHPSEKETFDELGQIKCRNILEEALIYGFSQVMQEKAIISYIDTIPRNTIRTHVSSIWA